MIINFFKGWKAASIGKNSKTARTSLEKRYNIDMEIEDAIHTALLALKEGFEGKYLLLLLLLLKILLIYFLNF
jgi:20S proteasome alpha/beta subunit